MIAEVIAMIAPQDDDGVVGKPFAFERLENLADLDIDVGNAGIIAVQQLALQFGRKLVAADVPRRLAIGVDLAALLVGIGGGAFGQLFEFGHRQLRRIIHVPIRSEEHKSELQSLMRNSYAVFCLKQKTLRHKSTTYI